MRDAAPATPELTQTDNDPQSSRDASGSTPSEEYLARLCGRTFLQLWSFPNLYRDQGKAGGGDGKEICDLLVVCGEDIIIFSDKACRYPTSVDPDLAWRRWYRTAVEASAKQIWGAERWLREHPDRVFLDRACTAHLPITLPDLRHSRIHRIVVTHGLPTDTGTAPQHPVLRLIPGIVGSAHYRMVAEGGNPLAVGQVDPGRGFVHVLDDAAVQLLLNELDTIADLVKYLKVKEDLVTGGWLVSAETEIDLVGYYMNRIGGPSQIFHLPRGERRLTVTAGSWDRYIATGRRAARVAANKVSYAWDELINSIAARATTTKPTDLYIDLGSMEKILRSLARESRLRRRLLITALLEKARSTPRGGWSARVILPLKVGDGPTYVMFPYSPSLHKTDEEYRQKRHERLGLYCMAYKARHPEVGDIVGIATEPGELEIRSADVIHLDSVSWTPERQRFGEEVQNTYQFLRSMTRQRTFITEYPPWDGPLLSVEIPGVPARRKPCPCGSGKRLKNCHGPGGKQDLAKKG